MRSKLKQMEKMEYMYNVNFGKKQNKNKQFSKNTPKTTANPLQIIISNESIPF
jgi:hypothetical protein